MTSGPSDTACTSTASKRLARRLEQDMQERGLGPGDRYITAAEAGQLLSVSRATANSAMSVLAERQLLVRHRRRGTFGGPKLKRLAVVGAPTVCVLAPEDSQLFDSILADDVIAGVRQGTGTAATVQFCALPPSRAASQVNQIIDAAQHASDQFGVLARSCPPEVYQCLIDNHVPSVAIGTVYPGQEDLPSIDHDLMQGGRLLMEHLIRRGHERMAVLFLSGQLAGDSSMLVGLHDAMSDAGLAPNALQVRSVPRDPIRIAADVEHLLAQSNRPTAVISILKNVARIVIDTASAKGCVVPDELEVVFGIHNSRGDDSQPIEQTQLRYAISPRQMFEQAGQMLERLWRGVSLEQTRTVIPAALCERESVQNHSAHREGA